MNQKSIHAALALGRGTAMYIDENDSILLVERFYMGDRDVEYKDAFHYACSLIYDDGNQIEATIATNWENFKLRMDVVFNALELLESNIWQVADNQLKQIR